MKRNLLPLVELSPEIKLSVMLIVLFVGLVILFSRKEPTEIEENHFLIALNNKFLLKVSKKENL